MITKEQIKEAIEKDVEYKKYADKHIYSQCVKDLEKIDLENITEKDVQGPIRTFLLNWGMMGRSLSGNSYKGWDSNLCFTLQQIGGKLQKFRTRKLEDTNLDHFENEIQEYYNKINSINGLGATAVSKILHVTCPYFFPLSDQKIRNKLEIRESSKAYFKFMKKNQELLEKYEQLISDLSMEFGKPKLKILDEILYNITR